MDKIADIADYRDAIRVPSLIKASQLQGGSPEIFIDNNGMEDLVQYSGGYCVVFPFKVTNEKFAVRCWWQYLEDAQYRSKQISEYLSHINLPYFVEFKYVEEGIATQQGVMPLVVMEWVDAKTLKDYIEEHLNDKSALEALNNNFFNMVKDLHKNHISHGDLQHGNIMVKMDGSIILVDYDSMYIPSLSGKKNLIAGLGGYQHPLRWKQKVMSEKSDYFSELIIYTSILALKECPSLWDTLQMKDTDTMVFSDADIKSGGFTPIFNQLREYDNLKYFVDVIVNELGISSLDSLMSLEEIVKGNVTIDDVLDEMSDEWNNPIFSTVDPNKDQGPSYDIKDVEDVSKEWQ